MVKLEKLNIKKMERSAAQASALMRALGHEKRLLILCHLSGGELSVGALAGRLDLPQSPLSQHLARLRKDGLVDTRREAQTIYYRLSNPAATKIVKTLYKTYCG
ncbi:MAG: metalloregulator ArsR/SmtB family transcription factor [Proteobacteria bacterium]|nr:metalloregulator ArsR/SmtB family transcription factor [Pseudomonadota bacterium]MDA1057846.1 metalloregulator ArsR/SmtB family transcription factor [Pseudomonadota bacterium]